MPSRDARAVRRTAALALAAMVAAGPVDAASAAPSPHLGSLTLTPTSGTVDGTPMLTSVTTSGPCAAGHGRMAQLRVGPPGGPYSNSGRPGRAGAGDRAAFVRRRSIPVRRP